MGSFSGLFRRCWLIVGRKVSKVWVFKILLLSVLMMVIDLWWIVFINLVVLIWEVLLSFSGLV